MTSVGNVNAVPVVDLRASSGQLRRSLRAAAHEVGFFYLTNHGVPEALVSRVLEAARRLFELPEADKSAVAMVRSPHFRGYTRLGGELTRGEVDWREQIDIGPERAPIGGPGKPDYLWLQGPNQWPATLPELPGIIGEWDATLSSVARSLLRHWAASLGSPPDVFDSAFAEAPATIEAQLRAALSGYFSAIDADQRGARITLLEVLGVSTTVDKAYAAQFERFAGSVEALAGDSFSASRLPKPQLDVIAQGIFGAITQIATQWLLDHRRRPRAQLIDATYVLVLAVLGQLPHAR